MLPSFLMATTVAEIQSEGDDLQLNKAITLIFKLILYSKWNSSYWNYTGGIALSISKCSAPGRRPTPSKTSAYSLVSCSSVSG